MSHLSEYSIGLFAPAFPRDPININVYLEHVLMGQVIEPLFTFGDDGQLKGAVAEGWEFNDTFTEIKVAIRKDLFFSNGKNLVGEDVKYSLDRHIYNSSSQSFNYLQVIKSLNVISEYEILFELKHPYVPFLLSLTREQLGIVPTNWKFNLEDNEPYIGTGPYRLVKETNQWFLVSNIKSHSFASTMIHRWKLNIIDTVKSNYPIQAPDLTFLAINSIKQDYLKLYPNLEQTHQEVKSFSFYQYSFWWLKDQYNSFSQEERLQVAQTLKVLSECLISNIGGDPSTGIIPLGILGTLSENVIIERVIIKNTLKIKLVVPYPLLKEIETIIKNNSRFKFNQVEVDLIPFSLTEVSKIKAMDATLVLIGYAGGFFDPEGYLTVLPSILGNSTEKIFGEKAEKIRQNAEKEQIETVRADLYRQFSSIAQKEVRYIPGFMPYFSEFRSKKITKKLNAFKYSYKLVDYVGVNQEEGMK